MRNYYVKHCGNPYLKSGLKLVLTLSIILLLLIPGYVQAAEREGDGLTGLIYSPTVETVGFGILNLGFANRPASGLISVNYGLFPDVELGFALNLVEIRPEFFAKLALLHEEDGDLGLALGMTGDDLFLVARKRLTKAGINAHLGLGQGRYGGVFAGLDWLLEPSIAAGESNLELPSLQLMAEYINHNVNLGSRMNFSSGFYFDMGYLAGSDIYFGLGYNIDL
ncbi:MAG: hypothetical protein UMV23_01325 [Halanaerobium sp.]|nr:hypothetical protein [Halanaerobium sp.]